jgi:hypothetical protein
MNQTGNEGILNPYNKNTQYRMHIMCMDQNQTATIREESNPDQIFGNSGAGYKIIIKIKD